MHFVFCMLPWLPLIGAALNRHRPRQYDDPSGAEISCKDVSLTQPSWYIFDPEYNLRNFATGGTHGDAGFSVYNTATNESFACYVKGVDLTLTGDELPWYDCSIPNAKFTFDKTANEVGVKEFWTCDNAPTLEFSAEGTTEIPIALGCGSDVDYYCLFGNTMINPTLSSPIGITPFEPWLPRIPWEYPEFCAQRSYYPTWEVDDLLYNHTAEKQSLSFTLKNLANGNTALCDIDVSEALARGSDHLARWVDCNSDSPPKEIPEGGVSGTKVTFDRDYSVLGVQQTWRCRDNDTSETHMDLPAIYSGLGYVVSGLSCTTPEHYDGTREPTLNAYTCNLPSTNISGYQATDVPEKVPHTSYAHSCTINSMNNTAMTLTGYNVESNTGKADVASFAIFNPGPGDEYGISNVELNENGDWNDCGAGNTSLPWQLLSCHYLIDRDRNKIAFDLQWNCDDRDPYHAVVFSATASGEFPELSCEKTGLTDTLYMTSCTLPSGSKGVALEISGLNWTATSRPMDRGPTLPWV